MIFATSLWSFSPFHLWENWGVLERLSNLLNDTKLMRELRIWTKCVWPWLLRQSPQWLGYTASDFSHYWSSGLGPEDQSQVQMIPPSQWFLLPSDSYICHFFSTGTGTSFISGNCVQLTSALLAPEFYSPKPFSVLRLHCNGLKHNFDPAPLLFVTFAWILKASGMKSECLRKELVMFHHLSQYTLPFLLSADPSCQTKYPIYSLSPKRTSVPSPLNLLASPRLSVCCVLFAQIFIFISKPWPNLTSFVILVLCQHSWK